MKVTRIELEHFRNIERLEMEPGDTVNIIYGDNAQGKTNLMEALWMFTGAKSFRSARETELIQLEQPVARMVLAFEREQREQQATIAYARGRKKQVTFNRVPLESSAQLAGRFYAVVFSPAHLSFIQDGPAVRRRFLDSAICQIMPRYLDYLTDYHRVLRQRNALLKDLRKNRSLMDLLEVFDQTMAGLSANLIKIRRQYIKRLSAHSEEIYNGISHGGERLTVEYRNGFGMELPQSSSEPITPLLLEKIKKSRQEDIFYQSSQVGPHRDDIAVFLNGLEAKSFGSQGQQRSCVLSLKLSESIMIEESTGQSPVILLDDVMSELDSSRRDYLLNSLEGRQVFITCCEPAYFQGMNRGRLFKMEKGHAAERQFLGDGTAGPGLRSQPDDSWDGAALEEAFAQNGPLMSQKDEGPRQGE